MLKGNKVLILILLQFNLIVVAQSIPGSPPDIANDQTWHLVWSDEFEDSDGPLDCVGGGSRWERKSNFDQFGSSANCVFINANAYELGGNLVLRFAQESYSCPSVWWGSAGCANQGADPAHLPYPTTGGYVVSRNDHTQYGYVEAEIKLDYANPLIATFWTLGDVSDVVPAISPTNAGEIDIFEMVWGVLNNAYTMTTNVHYVYTNNSVVPPIIHQPDPPVYTELNVGNYDGVWRKFSMEWNPEEIIWYVDGVAYRKYTNHEIVDPLKMLFTFGLQPNFLPDGTTPMRFLC